MPLTARVTKVIQETAEVQRNDHEAMARAAIHTVFNWLSDPSEDAVHSTALHSHVNSQIVQRVWSQMLIEFKREAGIH